MIDQLTLHTGACIPVTGLAAHLSRSAHSRCGTDVTEETVKLRIAQPSIEKRQCNNRDKPTLSVRRFRLLEESEGGLERRPG